jgi:serine/threonine-protein kinase
VDRDTAQGEPSAPAPEAGAQVPPIPDSDDRSLALRATRISAGPQDPDRPPPPPQEPGQFPPGTLLANTFRVERRLGGGGMGEVYLARHAGLGTEHAIKSIQPALARDPDIMGLFYREARVLRELRHDAVVKYDGFVRDALGRDFLVMEYAAGPSLAERLARQPLTVGEVLALRDRLCSGLAEAHRCGAIHRDLSPDNVILPGERIESAKLIDFGLCRFAAPGQRTIVGTAFAGKYRYASPEQFGLYGGEADARSDLYSLGLTLAAAALGRPLEMGETPAECIARRQRPPELGELPAELRPWLCALLQPDPAHRPSGVAELLRLYPAPSLAAPPTPKPEAQAPDAPPGAPRPRRRASPAILAILLTGTALGLALGLYLARPAPQPPQPPQGAGPAPEQGEAAATGPLAGAPLARPPETAPPAAPGPAPEPAAPPAPSPRPEAAPPAAQAPPTEAAATPAPTPASSAAEPDPPQAVRRLLDAFECAALSAMIAPDGALTVSGLVRRGDKTALYDRLRQVHGGRVDVTAVTTEPWPLCAVAARVRTDPARTPRVSLVKGKTSLKLGESMQIRIRSTVDRSGHVALAYLDSGAEVFHILPYAGDPDSVGAGATLEIAPLVAEQPVGPAWLIATWCEDPLYAAPPPEKQDLPGFVAGLAAALESAGGACATSWLALEIRTR